MASKTKKTPPPANQSGALEVSQRQILTILNRQPGVLHTVDMILAALKKTADIFDNKAAVIGAACMVLDRGKCESGWVGEGAAARVAWKVPLPKTEDAA